MLATPARLASTAARCWGFSKATDNSATAPPPGGASGHRLGLANALQLTGGYYSTCAPRRRDGACWGYNGLRPASTDHHQRRAARRRRATNQRRRPDVGIYHACAARTDGMVWWLGHNNYDRLGDGVLSTARRRWPCPGLSARTQVAAGGTTRARCADGTVIGAGSQRLRLGDGTSIDHLIPAAVPASPARSRWPPGFGHTCTRSSWAARDCAAGNHNGNAHRRRNHRPATPPVTAIGAHGRGAAQPRRQPTCARLADGTARCWGYNGNGAVGGQDVNHPPSRPRSRASRALQGSHLHRTTCAVLADTTVRCWGDNINSQVGDNTTS